VKNVYCDLWKGWEIIDRGKTKKNDMIWNWLEQEFEDIQSYLVGIEIIMLGKSFPVIRRN